MDFPSFFFQSASHVSPESEPETPLTNFPTCITSPLTASLSSRSSRVSASAMSVIAATVTSHAQVVGTCDPTLPALDEFTTLLSTDDVRVLVDLLKLAIAERAGSRAKERISNVLIGTLYGRK